MDIVCSYAVVSVLPKAHDLLFDARAIKQATKSKCKRFLACSQSATILLRYAFLKM